MSQLDRTQEFTDKVFTRDRAAWWAGFDVPGVNVCTDKRLTVREAFDLYLPWQVDKVQLVDGESFDVTPYYGIKRSDTGTILGVGTAAYTVVQNSEVEQLLSEALNGTDYAVASIGALAHGRTTFVSVDFDDAPTIEAGQQKLYPYLCVANDNGGTGSLRSYATSIRPECYNTLDAGWLTGERFAALRHTASITDRLQAIRHDIRRFLNLPEEAAAVVRKLIDTRVDATAYRKALETASPIPQPKVKDGKVTNQHAITIAEGYRDKLLTLAYEDERVGYEGSLWGLFQTFSTYDQWERRIRRTKQSGITTIQQSTLDRLLSGKQAATDGDRLALAIRAADVDGVKLLGKAKTPSFA